MQKFGYKFVKHMRGQDVLGDANKLTDRPVNARYWLKYPASMVGRPSIGARTICGWVKSGLNCDKWLAINHLFIFESVNQILNIKNIQIYLGAGTGDIQQSQLFGEIFTAWEVTS